MQNLDAGMATPGELQWSSAGPAPVVQQQDQVQVLCQELVEHLKLIMDPSSSHEIRNTCTRVSSN